MITVESLSSIPSAVFASLIIANVFEPTVTFEPAVAKSLIVLAVKSTFALFLKLVPETYHPASIVTLFLSVVVPSSYTYSVSPTLTLAPLVGAAPTASITS